MKKKDASCKIKLLCLCLLAAAIICLVLLWIFAGSSDKKEDLRRISSETYDSVFLSMYPITEYNPEDYAHYRGMTLLKTSHILSGSKELSSYINKIAKSGNVIHTVYLGICPEQLSVEELLALTQNYASVTFEVIPSYSSLSDWCALSEESCDTKLNAYENLVQTALAAKQPNLRLYNFGTKEWLIGNPANYLAANSVNADVAFTLAMNTDADHSFLFTPENMETSLSELGSLIASARTSPSFYPDLTGKNIVFFGDSFFGNYTDSTSIPGVVNGLTNAQVFNCGLGGSTAAMKPDSFISLPGITEAFVKGDLSALSADSQVYRGIASYLETNSAKAPDCFVINYGINDYYDGLAVSSEDPYDISTYAGALRTAVQTLREAYNDIPIILQTPIFTTYFSNGTERNSAQGGVLEDYVNAALTLGEELQVIVLNNYTELGINKDNQANFLLDGCHPNEQGRFLMGTKLIEKLQDLHR